MPSEILTFIPVGRKKLERFAANELANNIIQDGKEIYSQIKGQWGSYQFKNNLPLVVELGCGRGEYSVGLARAFKDKNFIGVDIKGNRIWKGSQQAIQEGLTNVAFLRTKIENISQFFGPEEISEIWITFPDPRPRGRDEKRRLTHLRFLQQYQQLLQPDGIIHLKTDNPGLFEYTRLVLEVLGISPIVCTHDLYTSSYAEEHLGIKTKYEVLFYNQGFSIKYLRFQFPENIFRGKDLAAIENEITGKWELHPLAYKGNIQSI